MLTFIVCTSIVFNLIVKEHLADTGSTHGKLDNLKVKRENVKGAELGEKVEESAKQKYISFQIEANLSGNKVGRRPRSRRRLMRRRINRIVYQ